MSTLVVTGTGTGVGKTVVTAALAALCVSRSGRCTVIKPAQTGADAGRPADLDEVVRLAGDEVDRIELARYPDALSPAAAARRSGLPPVDPAGVVQAVLTANEASDLVLVDGVGGLLVRFDEDGYTLAELARTMRLPVLIVVESGPGAPNAAALTLEVMAHRGVEPAGLVIGAWPDEPGPTDRSNLLDLEMLAARPLLGALPAGLGSRDRADFLATARAGLAPALGGTFDPAGFRRAHA